MLSKNDKDFSLTTIIDNMISSELLDVRTCIPVLVTRVDGESVDVEIVVERILEDGSNQGVAALLGIPLVYFGNEDYNITFPVSVGDEGLVLFGDRDIQQFLETGKQSAPVVLRNHDLSDALFLPVNLSRSKRTDTVEPNRLVLKAGTTKITLTKDGAINIEGDLVTDSNINTTGDITTTGDVVAGTISLKTHTHPGDNTPPTP